MCAWWAPAPPVVLSPLNWRCAAGTSSSSMPAERGVATISINTSSSECNDCFAKAASPVRAISVCRCLPGRRSVGTTVNWQSCFRTPDDVREEWAELSGCSFFETDAFTECLDAVWRRIGASTDESEMNESNATICRAAQKLDYQWNTIARNSLGCDLSQ